MNTRKISSILATVIAVALACAANAFALTYGNNITIFDKEEGSGYTGVGTGREDNEAEQGMVQSQAWDLEGVFRKGNVLTMIGGFNFKAGVSGYPSYTSGDIFISTDTTYGAPIASSDNKDGFNDVKNTYGYEYALKVDWSNLTYKVYKLNPNTTTTTVFYTGNETGTASSNPWKYVSGGTEIGFGTGTGGGLINNSITTEYNLQRMNGDDNHYAVSFDMSSVFADANLYGKDFYTHFTMGCGNDNLIGHDIAPVPEPGTMMLLGFGMLGLAIFGKRRMNREN